MPTLPLVICINYAETSQEIFQVAGQGWHTGPPLSPASSPQGPRSPHTPFPPGGTHHTPHLFDCVCFSLSLLLKALNGPLVWRRDNGLYFMGLFTIGKIALKRESRRDSYSKRPDCEAILLLGVWQPPHLFLAICQALLHWEWPLSFVPVSLEAAAARLCGVTHFRSQGAPVH